MQCGEPLAKACPECRTELPAEAQFCFSCGHRLGGAAAPVSAILGASHVQGPPDWTRTRR